MSNSALKDLLEKTIQERDQYSTKYKEALDKIFDKQSKLEETEQLNQKLLAKISEFKDEKHTQPVQQEIQLLHQQLKKLQTQNEILKSERPRLSEAFRPSLTEETSMYQSKTDLDNTPGPADLDALRYLQEQKLIVDQQLHNQLQQFDELKQKYEYIVQEHKENLLTISQLQKSNQELSDILELMDKDIEDQGDLQKKVMKTTQQNQKLQNDLTLEKAKKEKSLMEKDKIIQELDHLKNQLDRKSHQFQCLEEAYFELDKENQLCQQKCSEQVQDIKKFEDLQSLNNTQLIESKTQIQMLKDQNNQYLADIKDSIINASINSGKDTSLDHTECQKEIKSLNNQIQQSNSQVIEHKEVIMDLKDQLSALQKFNKDKLDYQQKIDSQQQIISSLEQKLQQVEQNQNQHQITNLRQEFTPDPLEHNLINNVSQSIDSTIKLDNKSLQTLTQKSATPIQLQSFTDVQQLTNILNIVQQEVKNFNFVDHSTIRISQLANKIDQISQNICEFKVSKDVLFEDNVNLSQQLHDQISTQTQTKEFLISQVQQMKDSLLSISQSVDLAGLPQVSSINNLSIEDILQSVQIVNESAKQLVNKSNQVDQSKYDEILQNTLQVTVQKNDLDNEVTMLKQQLEDKNNIIQQMQLQTLDVTKKNADLQTENSQLLSDIKSLSESCLQMDGMISSMKLSQIQSQNNDKQQVILDLQRQVSDLQDQIIQKDIQLQYISQETSQLKIDIQGYDQKLVTQSKEFNQIQEIHQRLLVQFFKIKEQLSQFQLPDNIKVQQRLIQIEEKLRSVQIKLQNGSIIKQDTQQQLQQLLSMTITQLEKQQNTQLFKSNDESYIQILNQQRQANQKLDQLHNNIQSIIQKQNPGSQQLVEEDIQTMLNSYQDVQIEKEEIISKLTNELEDKLFVINNLQQQIEILNNKLIKDMQVNDLNSSKQIDQLNKTNDQLLLKQQELQIQEKEQLQQKLKSVKENCETQSVQYQQQIDQLQSYKQNAMELQNQLNQQDEEFSQKLQQQNKLHQMQLAQNENEIQEKLMENQKLRAQISEINNNQSLSIKMDDHYKAIEQVKTQYIQVIDKLNQEVVNQTMQISKLESQVAALKTDRQPVVQDKQPEIKQIQESKDETTQDQIKHVKTQYLQVIDKLNLDIVNQTMQISQLESQVAGLKTDRQLVIQDKYIQERKDESKQVPTFDKEQQVIMEGKFQNIDSQQSLLKEQQQYVILLEQQKCSLEIENNQLQQYKQMISSKLEQVKTNNEFQTQELIAKNSQLQNQISSLNIQLKSIQLQHVRELQEKQTIVTQLLDSNTEFKQEKPITNISQDTDLSLLSTKNNQDSLVLTQSIKQISTQQQQIEDLQQENLYLKKQIEIQKTENSDLSQQILKSILDIQAQQKNTIQDCKNMKQPENDNSLVQQSNKFDLILQKIQEQQNEVQNLIRQNQTISDKNSNLQENLNQLQIIVQKQNLAKTCDIEPQPVLQVDQTIYIEYLDKINIEIRQELNLIKQKLSTSHEVTFDTTMIQSQISNIEELFKQYSSKADAILELLDQQKQLKIMLQSVANTTDLINENLGSKIDQQIQQVNCPYKQGSTMTENSLQLILDLNKQIQSQSSINYEIIQNLVTKIEKIPEIVKSDEIINKIDQIMTSMSCFTSNTNDIQHNTIPIQQQFDNQPLLDKITHIYNVISNVDLTIVNQKLDNVDIKINSLSPKQEYSHQLNAVEQNIALILKQLGGLNISSQLSDKIEEVKVIIQQFLEQQTVKNQSQRSLTPQSFQSTQNINSPNNPSPGKKSVQFQLPNDDFINSPNTQLQQQLYNQNLNQSDINEINHLKVKVELLETQLQQFKLANSAIQNEEYLQRQVTRFELDLKNTLEEYDICKKQIIELKNHIEVQNLTIKEQKQQIDELQTLKNKYERLSQTKELQDEQLANLRQVFQELRNLIRSHFGTANQDSELVNQVENLLSTKRKFMTLEKEMIDLKAQLAASEEQRKSFRKRAREERNNRERAEQTVSQLEHKVDKQMQQLVKYRADIQEIRQYAQEYASAVQQELKSRLI